ncbi:MAG: ABC transporter ATP-binding protein [Anaerolineae bacterium]|nr:ABC transporter ATP-binding protein [Anaerolineae bacterium]
MPPIIEIRKLKKHFNPPDGVVAVKGIDLDIMEGEIFSLLGPNGAGKTTAISMMSGLLTPTDGDAIIAGHSITRETMAAKQAIGVVPQELAIYPTLTARQNLNFFGKMYGLRGRDLKQRVDEVLDFTGLADRANDPVEEYSGGMKRRVNIGIGLLHRPQIVFLDEPTVAIDPQSRRNILDAVKNLNAGGMTVLYTTHYMEEAQELSNRVGIIDHGEIIALGTQDELTRMVGEQDTVRLTVPDVPPEVLDQLRALDGVTHCQLAGDGNGNGDGNGDNDSEHDRKNGEIRLLAGDGRAVLPDVIQVINRAGLSLRSIEITEPTLEAVFLHLTGRALRD